jgi:hypothetical protein
MSKGKYSPTVLKTASYYEQNFIYNAKGEIPPDTWERFNPETHFGNYDKEGYDSYGYSAYDKDGKYVGVGEGVDRNGYTETDYLLMTDDEYYNEHL